MEVKEEDQIECLRQHRDIVRGIESWIKEDCVTLSGPDGNCFITIPIGNLLPTLEIVLQSNKDEIRKIIDEKKGTGQ